MGTPNEPLRTSEVSILTVYDGVVRLTGRVDVLVAQQTSIVEDLKDHETRLRALESRPSTMDLDTRLRTLEAARWPIPALTVLISLAALALVLIQTFK